MYWLFPAVQGACISLATSRHCPEYKDFSIESFQGVSTPQQFDAYIDSNAAFNFGTSCPQWNTARQSRIKYSSSFACSYAVYYSTTQRLCNQNQPPPRLLCRSSTGLAFQDVSQQLQRACPNTRMFAAYQEFQNLSQDQNCFIGIGQDATRKCGIGGAEADTYCRSNPTQLCCTATQNLVPSNSTATATALPSPSQASSPDALTSAAPSSSAAPTSSPQPQPSSPQTSTTAENKTNEGGINPLFIGAGAIGLTLVAILAVALFFMTKRKPKVEQAAGGVKGVPPVSETETMEVVFEYQANLFDELTLRVGDEVEVTQKFDDGWALGVNLSTGNQGTFPLACLASFGAGSEYRDSQYRDSQYTMSTSKRASSLYADSTAPGHRY